MRAPAHSLCVRLDGRARAFCPPAPRGATPSSAAPTSAPPSSFSAWLGVVLVVVLFSGGQFGYDQGVIFGVLTGIKKTFALSPRIVEVVTSWVT